jgi:trimeric autotransporter adhesin
MTSVKKNKLTAAASPSVIASIAYISPYGTMPPGYTTSGITVQTVGSMSPTPPNVPNPVLVIRLRQASSGVVIGTSATSGVGTSVKMAMYQPAFPLSATEPYMVDLIWVSSGTPQANIDWDSAIASAPVTAAEVMVSSASFDGTNVYATLDYGASGMGTGAQVNVFSLTGGTLVNIGSAQTQNNQVTVPITLSTYTPVFFISAQTAIPVTNAGAGSFSAPFSLGPQTVITNSSGTAQYGGIPQAVSAISAAAYDGNNLTVSWTLASQVGAVNPTGSVIQIMSGVQQIASFNGGPNSATIPLGVLGQSGLSVNVQTATNNISSAPVNFSLIAQVPVVTNVVVNGTTSVTATIATVPANLSAVGYLMDGSKILAGPVTASSNTFTFNYNAAGMVGLSIVARTVSANGIVTGPPAAPVALLATAPSLSSASIYTNPASNTQWCVDLQWYRLTDDPANVNSYTVTIFQGTTPLGTATTTGTTGTITFAKTAITPGQTQTIQLYATGVSGGNSPTQTLSALFTAPILTSLNTTNNQLALNWNAPAIPPANTSPVLYQPVVTASGLTIYSGAQTNSTQAAIPLSAIPVPANGTVSVMVNVSLGSVTLLADTSMGTGTNASPILISPAVNAITAAAVTNVSTINWGTVAGATAYTVQLTNGTSQAGITTTSYALTQALSPGMMLGYTILATGTSNGVTVGGPASSMAYVPTNSANVSKVRFDGSNVVATWEAVANALCYNVLIYDNSATPVQLYSGTTTETSSSFSVTGLNTAKLYTVYVQPVMNAGVGLSGTTQALFTGGYFLSQQPSSAAYPYVYPAQTMAALGTAAANPTAQAIVLYLPELGAASGALGTTPITFDPFTIEPSGNAALPYKLTIAGDAMAWAFTSTAIRAVLLQNYVNFMKALESPPAGNLPGAVPYGISLVQAAIASSLPQTFAEQLYYNFGLSTTSTVGAGYIDLRPGMILRISTGDYINTGTSSSSWVNGYAGASVLDFEIGTYTSGANWRVGFDSFLNVLASQGVLSVSTPAYSSNSIQAGLAGAVDLYYPAFVLPFYRLYIPSAITPSWAPESNTTTSCFTLAAASSYTALQSTTVDPTVTPTAYFRGRTTVEVMIKIMVNGNERLVPVGTSIGNLLEQLNMRPSTSSPLFKQLRVYRSVVSAITSLQTSAAAEPQAELRVDWNGLQVYTTGNGLNGMSAPLLPGDEIITNSY